MQRGTKVVIALIVIASLFAGVTLYAESTLRQAFQRQLLVVRATNTISSNAPSGTMIPADFGPHCAKAQFAQSGALIVQSDAIPVNATGVVYVHFVYEANGSFAASGGDNVAVFFFRSGATVLEVASAANNATTLFAMENRNSTLFIGATEYGKGQAFQSTYMTPVAVGSSTWTVHEAYEVTSLGFTTVTVQPPAACQ